MRKRTVKENKTGCFLAAKGMQVLGTGLLIALVLVCLPLTLPRMFGYHIYSVISGSMEPEIPPSMEWRMRERLLHIGLWRIEW